MARPTPEQIEADIKAAFDELDPVQMEVFRRMTPEQKGRAMADLISAMWQMTLTSERYFHPDLPESEIKRRAILRFMRSSEWTDPWMRSIFGLDK